MTQSNYIITELSSKENYLRSLAWKYAKTHDDVHDLVQDTMCKAIEKAHYFRHGSNFKAWISVVMRNIFINKYRKKRKQNHVPLCEEIIIAENPANFREDDMKVFSEEVHREIKKLSKKNQEVINLSISGLSYLDIAERLKLPIGTVKSRIHHARRILKQNIRHPKELV